jgi:hypothetical protein
MALTWEPLRVFGPPAILFGLISAGKLVYDLVGKDFRVATNTIVLFGLTVAIGLVGLIADLLVQLNRRRVDVMPATVDRP